MNCHVCELLDILDNGKPYCGKARMPIPAGQVSIPRMKERKNPGCTVPPSLGEVGQEEKFSLVAEAWEPGAG